MDMLLHYLVLELFHVFKLLNMSDNHWPQKLKMSGNEQTIITKLTVKAFRLESRNIHLVKKNKILINGVPL